ncbi:MAG: hypothetical protein ABGY29_04415 [bacterium]
MILRVACFVALFSGALMLLFFDGSQGQAPTAELVQAAAPDPPATDLAVSVAAPDPTPVLEPDELRALRARITELELLLAKERQRSIDREQEWVGFLRAISQLPLEQVPERPGFLADAVIERIPLEGDDGKPVVPPAGDSQTQRRRQLMLELNALLVSEQVLSMDVLEVGRIHEGWCGPVVVRLLDERGRPVGLLAAERLRLEVSRAGFGVTLVFEEGYERHAGVKIPFGPVDAGGGERTGLRRIHLPDLNPEPWVEAVPELVSAQDLLGNQDDGMWDLRSLRQRLDGLLRAAGSVLGGWRLVDLGGVVGEELRDVQLLERDGEGREVRRIFADRLVIESEPGGGMSLELEGGIQLRHGRRAPFLGGHYRIFLPEAQVGVWRAEKLPGLSADTPKGEPRSAADSGEG